MPPFLRLLPLPRQLTTDVPMPVAAVIGLLVSLPTTALRLAVTLPQRAVSTGVKAVGRYQELAAIGEAVLGLRGGGKADEDGPDDYPSYSMDTSAWGATDTDADIVSLFDRDGDEGPQVDDVDVLPPAERDADGPSAESVLPPAVVEEATPAARTTPVVDTMPGTSTPSVPDAADHPVTGAEAIAADTQPDAQAMTAALADRASGPAVVPSRADLPIDGYDGLSAAALRAQVAGLTRAQLTTVRDYESAHARRVTVLALLERAIARA